MIRCEICGAEKFMGIDKDHPDGYFCPNCDHHHFLPEKLVEAK